MLWQVLDQLRGLLSPGQLRVLVLSLVFSRSQDESRWTELLAESHPDLGDLLTGLPAENLADAHLPASAVRAMLEATDLIVRRMGGDRAFRHLLEDFATRAGVKGAEVYTPASVAGLLAGMADVGPRLTVYDPFCRSGEMLTAFTLRALDEEPKAALKLHGETPNAESLAFATMNATLHAQEYDLRLVPADEVLSRPSTSGRFSHIVANPPFNMSNWTSRDSRHWLFGPPPPGNANFAWLQHIVERLAADGQAAVLMPNGALSSTNRRERHIRAQMVETGCVEALVSLPPGLFRNTGIPVTVWLLTPPGPARAEILFVRSLEVGHVHSELSAAQTERIISAVRGWRHGVSPQGSGVIAVPLARIREEGYDLSPALYLTQPRYARADGDALASIRALVRQLTDQHQQAAGTDAIAVRVLRELNEVSGPADAAESGWARTRLGEVCELIPGAPTRDVVDGSVPVVKPKNIVSGRVTGVTDRVSEDDAASQSRYQIRGDDILCVRVGSIGRVALASTDQAGWVFGSGLICVRPSGQVDPQFLARYFAHPDVADWFSRRAQVSTAVPSISRKALETLPITLPPLETQRSIVRVFAVLDEKIAAHQRICTTTAELRDVLLPLLFSGRLTAPDP